MSPMEPVPRLRFATPHCTLTLWERNKVILAITLICWNFVIIFKVFYPGGIWAAQKLNREFEAQP